VKRFFAAFLMFLQLAFMNAAPASASGACRFSGAFMRIHATVSRMDKEVGEADTTVRRLYHTTLRRGYKRVENTWDDMRKIGGPILDALTNMEVSLDFTPDSDKTQATKALIASYQNAVHHLLDYAHAVIYYERTENSLRTYMWRRQYLSWGVGSDPNRVRTDDMALYLLDESATESSSAFMEARPIKRASATPWSSPAGGLLDAVFALKIEEHHYAAVCGAPFSAPILTAMNAVW